LSIFGWVVDLLALPTRKYAHLSLPPAKDKPGALNPQAPAIFNFTHLIAEQRLNCWQ
jgi:hypothetical protein